MNWELFKRRLVKAGAYSHGFGLMFVLVCEPVADAAFKPWFIAVIYCGLMTLLCGVLANDLEDPDRVPIMSWIEEKLFGDEEYYDEEVDEF